MKIQHPDEKTLKFILISNKKDRFPLPDQVEDRFRGNNIREGKMTENIPPHPSPLPPRGEGVRGEIFLPLFSTLQKRGENATCG